jgi:hypothetical protein
MQDEDRANGSGRTVPFGIDPFETYTAVDPRADGFGVKNRAISDRGPVPRPRMPQAPQLLGFCRIRVKVCPPTKSVLTVEPGRYCFMTSDTAR